MSWCRAFLENTFITFQRLHSLVFSIGTHYRDLRLPLLRLPSSVAVLLRRVDPKTGCPRHLKIQLLFGWLVDWFIKCLLLTQWCREIAALQSNRFPILINLIDPIYLINYQSSLSHPLVLRSKSPLNPYAANPSNPLILLLSVIFHPCLIELSSYF